MDDDPLIVKSLYELLRLENYDLGTATSGMEALIKLQQSDFNLVITDINMPEVDGFQLLKEVKAKYPEVSIILITGYGTIEKAVEAIKMGAFHYISKPLIDDEIKIIIERALQQQHLKEENENLKQQLSSKNKLNNIIGSDYKMQKIFEIIRTVADTKATVLITGESGTGKTIIARAIHHNSARANREFIEVNCGALPETLLESELFGHVKGAFTGAIKDKFGKFQLADKGTIFLDEISAASPAFQVKLLRVIQDREFERVGAHETIGVDVRIILATNIDLKKEVEKGDFREDLYYRINVVTIHLPPLRERKGDLQLLARHFLKIYGNENKKKIEEIHEDTYELLKRYSWPGNVRELENIIERAVVLTKNKVILPEDLPPSILEHKEEQSGEEESIASLKKALELPEKKIIEKALKVNKWNRQKTASMLKVNRTTLFNKMRKYGLFSK